MFAKTDEWPPGQMKKESVVVSSVEARSQLVRFLYQVLRPEISGW